MRGGADHPFRAGGVFVTSPDGGEITLFRLIEGDVSILSAACMMKGMDIELDMELEADSVICTIPKSVYKKIHDENPTVKDYTLEMISERFSDIMWLFNQYVFSNVASRLANAILEHRALAGTEYLRLHMMLLQEIWELRERSSNEAFETVPAGRCCKINSREN